jgi:hypothetical protein
MMSHSYIFPSFYDAVSNTAFKWCGYSDTEERNSVEFNGETRRTFVCVVQIGQERQMHTHTHRRYGDHINLLLFPVYVGK